MGINLGITEAKYGKVFLVVIVLVILLSEVSSTQRKINCRKFVFAPPCRGIAAKRDTQSHTSERFSVPAEDGDYFMDSQPIPANENLANANGLMGLLRKAASKSIEYDTGTNYLA